MSWKSILAATSPVIPAIVKSNLISRTDANADTITCSYDATGRLLKKTYPDNTEETYTYDPNGNLLTATNKHISYTFSYDVAGRMVSSKRQGCITIASVITIQKAAALSLRTPLASKAG